MRFRRDKDGMTALRKILTLGDKILIGALLLASLASVPLMRSMTAPGQIVRIETDGTLFQSVSLFENRTIAVPGPLGKTLVEIRDGRARIVASPCANKLCVNAGSIALTGHIIACIPNKVVVRITGGPPAAYDAITQ